MAKTGKHNRETCLQCDGSGRQLRTITLDDGTTRKRHVTCEMCGGRGKIKTAI